MNLFTKQKQTHRLREQMYVAGEKDGGKWQGVCDWHLHTAIFKMGNKQGPTI